MFYFYTYLGKWSNLTNIFQMGWNHQPEDDDEDLWFFLKGALGTCNHNSVTCQLPRWQTSYGTPLATACLQLRYCIFFWKTPPEKITWNLKNSRVGRWLSFWKGVDVYIKALTPVTQVRYLGSMLVFRGVIFDLDHFLENHWKSSDCLTILESRCWFYRIPIPVLCFLQILFCRCPSSQNPGSFVFF